MDAIIRFFSKQVVRLIGFVALILVGLFLLNKIFPFIQTSYELRPTALGVKEVRDIGELISAEYYGEFIHSLEEGFQPVDTATFRETYDSLRKKVIFFYRHYENEQHGSEIDRDKIWKQIQQYFQDNSSLRASPIYLHLLRLSEREFANLKKIKKGPEVVFLQTLRNTSWTEFIQNKAPRLLKEASEYRNELFDRVEIHYLCRGWVKAGYDLTQLKMDSLYLNKEDSIMEVRNIDPYILAADINPWFIPPQGAFTEGVPGYELLRVRQKGKDVKKIDFRENGQIKKVIPFRLINQTKITARIELIREALERNIFQTAQSSAEESLFQLIRMVDPNNERGIKGVKIIHSDDFSAKIQDLENTAQLTLSNVDSLQHYIHLN